VSNSHCSGCTRGTRSRRSLLRCFHRSQRLDYVTSNGRMIMNNQLRGFGWKWSVLIEIPSRQLPGETEEDHEKPQSGDPISQSRPKSRTSCLQTKRVTAAWMCSLPDFLHVADCWFLRIDFVYPLSNRKLGERARNFLFRTTKCVRMKSYLWR
jgi:hypothetical protein